jgi:hypothetical protein
LGIPELYGFGINKIRPAPLPYLAAITYTEKNIKEQPLHRRLISTITKPFIHHVASVGGNATRSVYTSLSHSIGVVYIEILRRL